MAVNGTPIQSLVDFKLCMLNVCALVHQFPFLSPSPPDCDISYAMMATLHTGRHIKRIHEIGDSS
jgi:hypothetical protein